MTDAREPTDLEAFKAMLEGAGEKPRVQRSEEALPSNPSHPGNSVTAGRIVGQGQHARSSGVYRDQP